MGAVLATVGLAAAVVAAAAGGVVVVAAAAVVLGLAAAVDATRLLARHGARPVLPAAVLPIVGLPIVAAGDPAGTWAQVGAWYVATFVLASALLLVSGRRAGATLGLGGTMAVAAVVGLGAGALVLLAALPSGAGWLVVLALLAAAADLGDRLVRLAGRRGGRADDVIARPAAIAAVGATVVAAAVATALARGESPVVIAAVAAIVMVAGRVVVAVWRRGPAPPATGRAGPAPGGLLAACGTMLLAAPVAYLVIRVGSA